MGGLANAIGGLCDLVGSALNVLRQSSNERRVPSLFADGEAVGAAGLAELQSTVTPAPACPPMWQQAQAQVISLHDADPNFSEVDFLTQAARTYSAAIQATSASQVSRLAGSLSPAYRSRLQEKLDALNAAGESRVVGGLALDSSKFFNVSLDGVRQSITVRFTGSIVRWTRDDTTGAAIEGSRKTSGFIEFATFVRPAGSTTRKPSAGECAHCPHCGAPINQGDMKCCFCGAQLSGDGPWLLEKISTSAYT